MIDLTKLDFTGGNERDVEIPWTMDKIETNKDNIGEAFDMGAHYAWFTYAKQVKEILKGKHITGVDILPDDKTSAIFDEYIVGNVLDKSLFHPKRKYDCVFSISALEHAGISTYQEEDWQLEQRKVFQRMYELANKFLFVTFPFGMPALDKGQFGMIDLGQLGRFYAIAKIGEQKSTFFIRNEDKSWREVLIEEAAAYIYDPGKGVECICCLEIIKK